jgi:hypothetical protein
LGRIATPTTRIFDTPPAITSIGRIVVTSWNAIVLVSDPLLVLDLTGPQHRATLWTVPTFHRALLPDCTLHRSSRASDDSARISLGIATPSLCLKSKQKKIRHWSFFCAEKMRTQYSRTNHMSDYLPSLASPKNLIAFPLTWSSLFAMLCLASLRWSWSIVP